MAIEPNQKVKVKWVGTNIKHYKSLGYDYTKLYDEFEIPIEHLPEGSKTLIKIECDWCKEKVNKKRGSISLIGNHFCNAKCYGKWISNSEEGKSITNKRKTSIKTRCKHCNIEFDKKPSEFKGHGEHYCSRSCVAKDNFTKNNPNPKKEKVKVECNQCGKEFEVNESITKKNKWHFCSRGCYYSFRSENIKGDKVYNFQDLKTECEISGVEFDTIEWNLENGKDRFCSQECYYKHRSINYSGENHPHYGTKKTPEQIEKMRLITASRIANGEFPQTDTSIQRKVTSMIKELNCSFEEEIQFKYYVLDLYDETNNLSIEVMGDYWHANPIKFKDYDSLHDIQKKDVRRDKSKKTYLKKYYDMDVLYLWEYDINNNEELCKELIKLYVENNGTLEDYNSYNYEVLNGKLTLKKEIIYPYFMRANTVRQTGKIV